MTILLKVQHKLLYSDPFSLSMCSASRKGLASGDYVVRGVFTCLLAKNLRVLILNWGGYKASCKDSWIKFSV